MKTVRVKKDRLKSTLLLNKKTHADDFEVAWTEFKNRAIHNFEQRLKAAKNLQKGQQLELWVNMDIPENHERDYERALQMVEWEIEDEVELTESEFRSYVQDEWSWTGKFQQDNVYYTGSASPSKGR